MSNQMDMNDGKQFEQEVGRIAAALWPAALSGGAGMLNAKERDGIYITEECVHVLECTVSRGLDKAKQDIKKLEEAYQKFQKDYSDRPCKCWFVTKHEPTGEQQEVARTSKCRATAISLNRFQAKLIDVHTYLSTRDNYGFGSIADPTEKKQEGAIKYINIPILDKSGESWNTAKIANSLLVGECFTLLGDYGIGKSMTLREVYRYLGKKYYQNTTTKFPIYINLRDHQGQSNPSEIITRHATEIGFPHPNHLVRAWRAGYAVLLLDGFDEVGSIGLTGAWRELQAARNQAMTGVRKLVRESPAGTGVAVAGRHTFFDTERERNAAISDNNFKSLVLHEFNEEQIRAYLASINYQGSIPSWVPARPLLLCTVFSIGRNHLHNPDGWSLPDDPSAGWRLLMNAIAEREARIEAGVSSDTIKAILEQLAYLARSTPSGLGPITPTDIQQAFSSVTKSPPSPEAMTVLQRLPGLGVVTGREDGARVFIDEDLAEACAAGAIGGLLIGQSQNQAGVATDSRCLGDVGSGILDQTLSENNFDRGRYISTQKALERAKFTKGVLGDLILSRIRRGFTHGISIDLHDLEIPRLVIADLEADLSEVRFGNCVIRRLEIDTGVERGKIPYFDDCIIEYLDGFHSERDMPADRFSKCSVDNFLATLSTNASVQDSGLPVKVRVLLTVLRKLFVQGLSGRQESALRRGLADEDSRQLDDVLEAVRRAGFASTISVDTGTLWIPARRAIPRARAIISSPLGVTDPVIKSLI